MGRALDLGSQRAAARRAGGVRLLLRASSKTGEGTGRNVVAKVNGEEIPRDVFEFFREQNEETFKQYQQQGVDSEQLRKLIDEQTRASLLRRYLMAQEAEALGLSVSGRRAEGRLPAAPSCATASTTASSRSAT